MPVTDVTTDPDSRTITIEARFNAPVERVWALYADARQLEKVWGPPTHPATFLDHELTVGSRSTYFMTGPEGEKYAGFWEITGVDEPWSFAFEDGFADADDFTPTPGLPVSHNVFTFEAADGGTRAVYTSTYDTVEALQQVLDMGVEEGARSSIDQIDGFLAA
ncbi:SRPBCC family protein [Ornithinimicrobium cerasi]|uniref:Uncharacterized conserved protein YndB, AHSA1/START domain n=1 Tax=Ornithinimicrobium cerasi TaxID=2248773 RepID=A0A285W087_9MICO|nr:SRPBCC domain-containing protein [Ornithinimicrobium cerasi]SOC58341.1 Uncharacterized conserved protein YndB, AHSA1/START domain [Ornithinimicrobium cerasi]